MDIVFGKDINLSLVTQIGVIRSHSAHRITWHSHDGFELLFLLDGATAYEFKDGKVVHVPGDNFVVVGPKAVHRGVRDVRMPSTICGIVLDPHPQRHWRHTPFTEQDLKWMVELFKTSALTIHSFNRDLKRAINRLAGEKTLLTNTSEDSLGHAELRSVVCAAILEATHQLTTRRTPEPTEIARAAVAYLRENSHEPIQMSDLVKHIGFSRARLFQLFKANLGLTPNDFLQRVRIEKAQELLRTTDKTITDIAFLAGFSSSQYFSTVFRRYTGVTPAQYRQEHCK